MPQVRTDLDGLHGSARDVAAIAETLAAPPTIFDAVAADSLSAEAAAKISARAAHGRTQIQAATALLDAIAAGIGGNAARYATTEAANTAHLGGTQALPAAPGPPAAAQAGRIGSGLGVLAGAVAGSIPAVAAESSPEQFSQRLNTTGADPHNFTDAWTRAAAALTDAASRLAQISAAMPWSGAAAEAARAHAGHACGQLSACAQQAGAVAAAVAAHTSAYQDALAATPTPAQFQGWHAEIRQLQQAEAAFPMPHTTAALVAAENELEAGYIAAGAAAAAYEAANSAATSTPAAVSPQPHALQPRGAGHAAIPTTPPVPESPLDVAVGPHQGPPVATASHGDTPSSTASPKPDHQPASPHPDAPGIAGPPTSPGDPGAGGEAGSTDPDAEAEEQNLAGDLDDPVNGMGGLSRWWKFVYRSAACAVISGSVVYVVMLCRAQSQLWGAHFSHCHPSGLSVNTFT